MASMHSGTYAATSLFCSVGISTEKYAIKLIYAFITADGSGGDIVFLECPVNARNIVVIGSEFQITFKMKLYLLAAMLQIFKFCAPHTKQNGLFSLRCVFVFFEACFGHPTL